jgi:hypothetical protein
MPQPLPDSKDFFFFKVVFVHVSAMPIEARRGCRTPWKWNYRGLERLDAGAGKQTRVILCKSSTTCSQVPSHLFRQGGGGWRQSQHGRAHYSQEVWVPPLRACALPSGIAWSSPTLLPCVVHAASACAAPSQLVSARAKKPGSRSELFCRLQPARCQREQLQPECLRLPPRQARSRTMSAGGRCHAGWG